MCISSLSECQQGHILTKEPLSAAFAISRARTPPVALPLQHLHTGGGIDQASAVEEGPADQELPEETTTLEPNHLPSFKSSRLLEAAGCILSHTVLAALSAGRKAWSSVWESSSPSGCSPGPNPTCCLAPGTDKRITPRPPVFSSCWRCWGEFVKCSFTAMSRLVRGAVSVSLILHFISYHKCCNFHQPCLCLWPELCCPVGWRFMKFRGGHLQLLVQAWKKYYNNNNLLSLILWLTCKAQMSDHPSARIRGVL